VNRLLLQASVQQRGAMRWTPAGLPVLDLVLRHEGQSLEDGAPRKVSLEIRALGIGAVSRALSVLSLGQTGTFGGFLAPARNGRGLLFHITSVEPGTQPDDRP
jgi:primosomal replication protein N